MLRIAELSRALTRKAPSLRDSSLSLAIMLSLSLLVYLAVAVYTWPYDRPPVIAALTLIFAAVSLVKPLPHPRGGTLNPNVAVILTASLLWAPGEVLIGTGLGSALGLLISRRTDTSRVASNVAGWGLSAAASAQVAGLVKAATVSGLLTVALPALLAAMTYNTGNTVFFGLYRSIRYHRPFLSESWYGLRSQSWLLRLSDIPLAIGAVMLAHLAGTTMAALAVTAGSALVVPLNRWYAGLYVNRTMHARAGAAFEQSEQRFRALTAHISDGIALLTAEGVVLYVSPSSHDVLGYQSTDVVGRRWLDLYHPGDLKRTRDLLDSVVRAPGEHGMVEVRMRHQDNSWRWMETVYANRIMEPSVQAIVVTYRDISAQKQSEETLEEYTARLRDLSRQLVQAQEAERRVIARELHDEIGQILTGLRLILDAVQPEGDRAMGLLARAISMVDTLQARVRSLSLNLRPAALDDRGLLPALLLQCNQHTAHGLEVRVLHNGVSGRRFPPEVETTAYRVAQEGLTNVARHAGVTAATIRLWADEEILGIQVEDEGRGFVVPPLLSGTPSGGLSGMRERVALVGGEFVIESTPGSGTRVTAELPVRQPLPTSP